jgi:hypothetical protein
MIKRIYILEYRFYFPCGGSYKYAAKPEFEDRVVMYTQKERDAFIKEYQRLKELEDKDIYIDSIRCSVSTGIEDITGRMQEIIDSI